MVMSLILLSLIVMFGGLIYFIAWLRDRQAVASLTTRVMGTHSFRLGLVASFVLISQIPVLFIGEILLERQFIAKGVVGTIAAESGGLQTFAGPYLVVPYSYETLKQVTKMNPQGEAFNVDELVTIETAAVFLPQNLVVDAFLTPKEKQRSIYKTLIYEADLKAHGHFEPISFDRLPNTPTDIQWDEAYVSFGISNTTTLIDQPVLKFSDQNAIQLEPGGKFDTFGIHGFPRLDASAMNKDTTFAITTRFRGHQGLRVAPIGEQNQIVINSDWPHPDYQGLSPTNSSVSDDGFSAAWSVSSLNRDYAQVLQAFHSNFDQTRDAAFGVNLFERFGTYGQIDRAVKYAILVVGLTFATIFAIDFGARRRMHALQYLIVGGGLALFYLLLLSISEVFGFLIAFFVAAFALSISIGGYIASALRSLPRGLLITMVLLGLYGLIYTLLNLQDFALMVGSGLLFAVLIVIMFVTRNLGRDATPTSTLTSTPTPTPLPKAAATQPSPPS